MSLGHRSTAPDRHRSQTARRVLVAAISVSMFAGACTVGTNSEPQAVGPGFAPLLTTTTATTTTTAPQSVTKQASVYFLQTVNGSVGLTSVIRAVPVNAGISEILTNLFAQRPDPEIPTESGIETAIPESAQLISAQLAPASDVLVIDVRGLFGIIQGNNLRNALAQVVWTATQVSDVGSVRFLNDGVSVAAIAGNGDTKVDPVRREDYLRLN